MPHGSDSSAGGPRSVDEHRRAVAGLLAPMPVRRRPLVDCLGLVLAEDLTAPVPLPPFDNSAMDGFAVRAADVLGAGQDRPVELPVTEDIPAGRTDVPVLLPGTAHRIMTGAPLPGGADAVVPVELTDHATGWTGHVADRVGIHAAVAAGRHVRRAGEDVAAGAVVLTAGTVLTPARVGLAAAVGAGELPVHRPARVLVLSTGSELVEPGAELAPGQIYESNGALLAAAVAEIGGEATVLRFVPDDVAAFHDALAPHLPGADLLVTSGGVSAGAYEVVKDALAEHVEFVRVAVQPGGPQGCGRFSGVAVVTLPGNPVSSALSFELFVRPALLAAMGHGLVDRPRRVASLAGELTSPAGKRQYRRGWYDEDAGTVRALGGPGSHLLAALAAANCLIEIPEAVTALADGADVDALLLG